MPGLKNPVSVPARSTSASPLSTQARFILGALVGILIASGTIETVNSRRRRQRRNRKPRQKQARASDASDDAGVDFPQATIARPGVVPGVAGLIGNTPLMRINSLSELTGCEILGKAEFLNPAGSPKDRVALQILLDAERAGLIEPHRGDCVFEGTVGSTGISLATLCRAKGYRCSIVLPDDVATEKSALLEKLGAEVKKVRPRGIVDPRHFVNEARALAKSFGQYDSDHHQDLIGGSLEANENEVIAVQGPERGAEASGIPKSQARRPRGFFADQFETQSNFLAHYRGTGPEIWAQCGGDEEPGTLEGAENAHVSVKCHRKPQLDAFVAGAGTGGTLSGVAAALREREASIIKQALEDNAKQGAATRLWQRLSSPPQWFENREQSATSDMKQTASLIDPIRIVLADPVGSGLFNKVHHGVMYSATEAEGTRRRHQVDSIVEGIGMNRITRNLSFGVDLVDDAIRVQDEEAVRMSRWLSVRDGLFVGSSSCVNVIAAVKTALKLKTEWSARGKQDKPTVVTILCDSGSRHLSKFHNDQVLRESYGIELPADPMQVDISDLFC